VFIDARELSDGASVETEVCVVGAGLAGISLARALIGQPFRVCVLESGGLERDDDTQSLYKGESAGLPYFDLDFTRQRWFGGSTNEWGGWCAPLDPLDFEPRDWVPDSGWPITRRELEPYYERAHPLFQLGPYCYDPGYWEDALDGNRFRSLALTGSRLETKIWQVSPPTRFGHTYREEISRADNVSVYLHANVVEIETDAEARWVTRLRCRRFDGGGFTVTARQFVLATGGIETPRLLLLSNNVMDTGLGNAQGLVGRYFMEHPFFRSGILSPSEPNTPMDLYSHAGVKKTPVLGGLSPSPQLQRDEGLLNSCARLGHSYGDPHRVAALKRSIQSLRRGRMPDLPYQHFAGNLSEVVRGARDVAAYAYQRLPGRHRRFSAFILYHWVEQAPNPNSRITLSHERDRLGQNRVRLDWRLSAIDKRSARQTQRLISEALSRAGLGTLRVDLNENDFEWPRNMRGSHHHMGTTRMSHDSKRGVVDQHGRVHGLANLFIAGGSVFPTCGFANPGLTIAALACRLSDRIKYLLAGGS